MCSNASKSSRARGGSVAFSQALIKALWCSLLAGGLGAAFSSKSCTALCHSAHFPPALIPGLYVIPLGKRPGCRDASNLSKVCGSVAFPQAMTKRC